jgi:putative addiction module component (TIGR02574 family)
MNSDQTSVFDLSPSEKLQLVEDLWDDLAATPEAAPVQQHG